MKYDKLNDFVIDLDDIWKWLGFTNKAHSKRLIKSLFIADKDINILMLRTEQQDLEYEFMNGNHKDNSNVSKEASKRKHGGNNKEKIMMKITTFKKFCLKAGTKKADVIHDYFIKLEEALQEIVNEESNEVE